MTNHHQKTPPDVAGYEITRLIGLGGMGEVYLARQLALNRPVAIKFLSKSPGDPHDEYDVRFQREAELMARVAHPNVVTIFDCGNAMGRPYLVMEYVEDGDLRSRMVPEVPMKVETMRAILPPVIRAMQYLHRQGIVHRDMKPENILIHREETPKVTDFGLAVLDFAIGSLTRQGRTMGTPGYISPEQQYGLKVDERADQFSMAALCYEMATGRKPLGAYPPPSKLNPKLSQAAESAILKGLSQDPEDRFSTIEAFGDALDHGLSIVPRRPDRWRWAAILVALIAGLAALITRVPRGEMASGHRPGPILVPPGPKPGIIDDSPVILAKSVNMTLVQIPAGTFVMGSPDSDVDALPDERPEHRVHITRPFYLGITEVTVGQFREFVKQTGYKTTAETIGKGGYMFSTKTHKVEHWPELTWRHPGSQEPQGENEPVVQVSWLDAVAFCEWLSKVEGRLYRLPTEAEWEYACRAGTTTRWSSGDSSDSIDPFAWHVLNSGGGFHAVASKQPNPWRLHDMHGSVWEWCSDRFSTYGKDEVDDPRVASWGYGRVLRGGSFDWLKADRTRSASRLSYEENKCYFNYGFRVCTPVFP